MRLTPINRWHSFVHISFDRSGRSDEAFKRDKHDDVEDSDEDGDDNDDKKRWRYPDVGERERRDSGVGSSLTRRPSK